MGLATQLADARAEIAALQAEVQRLTCLVGQSAASERDGQALSLPYPPSGNNATRHAGAGRAYKTAAALAYRAAVLAAVAGRGFGRLTRAEPLQGPLALSWVLRPPDRRGRDVDNVRKESADALTRAGVWADDSNLVIVRERFEWSEPVPGGRIELTVEVLG